MASVASQFIEEVTAHSHSDSLEDVREICTDGTYFLNNLHICNFLNFSLQDVVCLNPNRVYPRTGHKGPKGE